MRKIVGLLHPFGYEQQFFVYEDGNKIDNFEITIDELSTKLFEIIQKYDIKQIDLTGSRQYTKGISNKIKEIELTKYNNNSIEINLI